ncbi:MAG: hypothetical protein RLZZ401_1114 [Pseudomonadota bacterium]
MQRRHFLAATSLPLLACQRGPDGNAGDAIAGGFVGTHPERGHALRDRRDWPAPAVQRRTRVLIAGGGVAGLAAARALRLRGVEEFAVFDLEDAAGGNSRAGSVSGVACPLGAHYLPLPGDHASEVQDFLEELGLRQRVAGRWQYDERHLCHSPQERLFFQGQWQSGLLPVEGVGAATLAQYRRFAELVSATQRSARFVIPTLKAPLTAQHLALDAQTFAAWLDAQGLMDAHLRWYLDYCCRDDYGAGSATVSAWAGLHYFASRHGFHAPGDDASDGDAAVLTWPEGNGFLTQALAQPLGDGRLHTGCTVLRVAETRHAVELDVWRHASSQVERWQAPACIVALPVMVAARVLASPPTWLQATAAGLRYAPWVVANIHLRTPLRDRPGAAPAWDNVVYDRPGQGGLGYVDARHQSLDPRPGPTVLTHYRALGDVPNSRQLLLDQPWQHWRDQSLAELAQAHPDLATLATHAAITRYGHAMAMPIPGALNLLRKNRAFGIPVNKTSLSKSEFSMPRTRRIALAHSDWSGYSIFEEAFTRGHGAGMGIIE